MLTSYFSNPALKTETRPLVAISRGVPKWFKGVVYRPLAPSWELVKISDSVKYTNEYHRQVLARLNPRKVVADLEGAIMLCYEKPGDFCHRRLVADWIEKETGLVVPELGQVKDHAQPVQGVLFEGW